MASREQCMPNEYFDPHTMLCDTCDRLCLPQLETQRECIYYCPEYEPPIPQSALKATDADAISTSPELAERSEVSVFQLVVVTGVAVILCVLMIIFVMVMKRQRYYHCNTTEEGSYFKLPYKSRRNEADTTYFCCRLLCRRDSSKPRLPLDDRYPASDPEHVRSPSSCTTATVKTAPRLTTNPLYNYKGPVQLADIHNAIAGRITSTEIPSSQNPDESRQSRIKDSAGNAARVNSNNGSPTEPTATDHIPHRMDFMICQPSDAGQWNKSAAGVNNATAINSGYYSNPSRSNEPNGDTNAAYRSHVEHKMLSLNLHSSDESGNQTTPKSLRRGDSNKSARSQANENENVRVSNNLLSIECRQPTTDSGLRLNINHDQSEERDTMDSASFEIHLSATDDSDDARRGNERGNPESPMTSSGMTNDGRWQKVMAVYDLVEAELHLWSWIVGCLISNDTIEIVVNLSKTKLTVDKAYDIVCSVVPQELREYFQLTEEGPSVEPCAKFSISDSLDRQVSAATTTAERGMTSFVSLDDVERGLAQTGSSSPEKPAPNQPKAYIVQHAKERII